MDLLIEVITLYGWQAVVISLFVFAFIECFKPLFRKVIKNENARHSLYTLLNYVVTLGFSAIMALILGRFNQTFQLYGSAIIVVNILYPIIANTGFFNWITGLFRDFFQRRAEEGSWKKAILSLAEDCGVDVSMLDTVATKIEEEYKQKILDGVDEFFTGYKDELILNIKQKLAGFVENIRLQDIAEKLFDLLWKSWGGTGNDQIKGDEVGHEENV